MSLADRLKDGAAIRLPSCTLCRLLAELPADDAAALAAAVGNPDWTISGLTLVIRSEGYKISEKSVSYHRKGLCLS